MYDILGYRTLIINEEEVCMKYILAVALLTGCCTAEADGFGTFSTGYRFGEITKYGVKGIIFSSGEGQMLLGNDSTVIKPTEDSSFENPWRFSCKSKLTQENLKNALGTKVVLKYKQSHIKSPNVDTDYEVTEVARKSDKAPAKCSTADYNPGIKSNTMRVGRIVKASSKGTAFNSYEIIMQMGNAGNQFKPLSITVSDMYECAVAFLKSGDKVRLEYSESLINMDLTGRETPYDVISIESVSN